MAETVWPTPYGDNPPLQWLNEPHAELSPETPMIISEDGRFSAISHEWNRTHNALPGGWTPQRSPSGNRSFHQGQTVTDEGEVVATGVIPFGGGHAPNLPEHLIRRMNGDPTRVKVAGRCVEYDDYAAICGYIVPGTSKSEVAAMLRTTLSGEWRKFDGRTDYYGPVFVDRGGLIKGMDSELTDEQIDAKFKEISNNYYTQKDEHGEIQYACGALLASSLGVLEENELEIVMEDKKVTITEAELASSVTETIMKLADAKADEEAVVAAGDLTALLAVFEALGERLEVVEANQIRLQSFIAALQGVPDELE